MSIMGCSECGRYVDTDDGGQWSEHTDRLFCDICADLLMDEGTRLPGDPGYIADECLESINAARVKEGE